MVNFLLGVAAGGVLVPALFLVVGRWYMKRKIRKIMEAMRDA